MEEKLKELMQELGNAINESLSDSDRIAAAIGEIKRAGYDVFLVLEATIGFNKREETASMNLRTAKLQAWNRNSPEAQVRIHWQDQVNIAGSKIPQSFEDRDRRRKAYLASGR